MKVTNKAPLMAQNLATIQKYLRLAVLFACLFISNAWALEEICPNGLTPRADIALCLDFDTLTNCTTGAESACLTDNGFNSDQLNGLGNFVIKNEASDAAVGNGYIRGRGNFGSTGAGYSSFLISSDGVNSVRMRYYVRYDDGYLTYGNDHGPGITGVNSDASCSRGGTLEQSQYGYYWYNTGTCGIGSFDLTANQTNLPVLKNGKWYRMEMLKTIDTSCTDTGSVHGCNGIAKMWIDGQLVLSYEDINWGGVTSGIKWKTIWGPRSYFHVGSPAWDTGISFDNFIVATSDAEIGAATNVNSNLGTEDSYSPYYTNHTIEAFFGRKFDSDCSAPTAYMTTNFGSKWRSGGVMSTAQNKGGIIDYCTPSATDSSFQVQLTSKNSGGGISFEAPSVSYFNDQLVSEGYIYLPSANDYTATGILTLGGFKGYKCDGSCFEDEWGRYAAFGVSSNSKWSFIQREATEATQVVEVESDTSIQTNTWLKYSFIVKATNKIRLKINDIVIFDDITPTYSIAWLFGSPTTSARGTIVGIIDQEKEEGATIYYDNISVGTQSFSDCTGWNPEICPFEEINSSSSNSSSSASIQGRSKSICLLN